jgi:hypothetical protein
VCVCVLVTLVLEDDPPSYNATATTTLLLPILLAEAQPKHIYYLSLSSAKFNNKRSYIATPPYAMEL